MALDTAIMIAQELLKLNAFLLLGIVVVSAFAVFKIFAFILRILLTGLAFATFPFIANFAGIAVPITVQSILLSAIAGIVIYFVYMGLRFGFKVMDLAFRPFKRLYRKKKVPVKNPGD